MIFSSDELMFLTIIAKCSKPFGINLEKIKDNVEMRGEQARQRLIDKGILKNDGITTEGIAVIRLWEEYCNATKFFICNRCVVALISNRRCVVSTVVDGGYDIASGDKMEVAYALLKDIEALRDGKKENLSAETTTIESYAEFRNRIKPFGENVLSTGAFNFKSNKRQERIFYWDDRDMYSFNPKEGEETIVDAPYVRRFIVDGLELEKGVLENG